MGSRLSQLTIALYLTAFPEQLYELNEPNELHEPHELHESHELYEPNELYELNRLNRLNELELSAFSAEPACALHADKLYGEGFCFIKGERLQQPYQSE